MKFFHEYFFLSNFYPAKFTDPKTGITYSSTEHFYQAHKTIIQSERQKIIDAPTPGKSKYLGRKCTIRKDWNNIKLKIMATALVLKFTQNENLKEKLIDTNTLLLEEGNTWGDTYWGVCNGIGRNELGKLLMKLRTELAK